MNTTTITDREQRINALAALVEQEKQKQVEEGDTYDLSYVGLQELLQVGDLHSRSDAQIAYFEATINHKVRRRAYSDEPVSFNVDDVDNWNEATWDAYCQERDGFIEKHGVREAMQAHDDAKWVLVQYELEHAVAMSQGQQKETLAEALEGVKSRNPFYSGDYLTKMVKMAIKNNQF